MKTNRKKTMAKKFKFSKDKYAWGKARPKMTLRGDPLQYNHGEYIAYQKALRDLLQPMFKQVKIEVQKLFESDAALHFLSKTTMDASITSLSKKLINRLVFKFSGMFSEKAEKIANNMVINADKISKNSLIKSLQKLSGGVTFEGTKGGVALKEIHAAAVHENVKLIKSIPEDYLGRVGSMILNSITAGSGLKDLIPQLSKFEGVTERRAKFIALDQTRKVYNSVNKQRMIDVNIDQFEWIHSGGSQEPRKSHQAMDGKVFSFTDLPIINKDNKGQPPIRGIPGQAPNCGCTMRPVYKFENRDSEEIEAVAP